MHDGVNQMGSQESLPGSNVRWRCPTWLTRRHAHKHSTPLHCSTSWRPTSVLLIIGEPCRICGSVSRLATPMSRSRPSVLCDDSRMNDGYGRVTSTSGWDVRDGRTGSSGIGADPNSSDTRLRVVCRIWFHVQLTTRLACGKSDRNRTKDSIL